MGKHVLAKTLVSGLIILIVSLQGFTTFRGYTYVPLVFPPASHLNLQRFRPPQLWPFLTYPMYMRAHYEGEQIPVYRLMGVLPDSTEVEVDIDVIGGFWVVWRELIPAMHNQDIASILDFVGAIENEEGITLRRIRLEDQPWVLEPDGLSQQPDPVVVREFDLDSLRTKR